MLIGWRGSSGPASKPKPHLPQPAHSGQAVANWTYPEKVDGLLIAWDINPDQLVFHEKGRTDKAYAQHGLGHSP